VGIRSLQLLLSAEAISVRQSQGLLSRLVWFVGKSQFQAIVVGMFESRYSDQSLGFVDGKVDRFRICGYVGFFF
jgi:hypothetical protein